MRPREAPQWEDAKLAIQEVGGWIRNADTKITVLAAATGVLFAASVSRIDEFISTKRTMTTLADLYLAALCVFGAALVTVGLAIYTAIRPRTFHGKSNRFAWPALARLETNAQFDSSHVRDEAWDQARMLSRVAKRKYRAFHLALVAFGVALLDFTVLAIWTAALT